MARSNGSSKSKGSGIHINPGHKGEFTRKAKAHGESVQEYANEVLKPGRKASAATEKLANFARNAKKFKH